MPKPLVFILLSLSIASCSEEPKPSKLKEITTEINVKFDIVETEVSQLIKTTREQGPSELKKIEDAMDKLSQGDLSESDVQQLLTMTDELKRSQENTDTVILNAVQSFADILALNETVAELCVDLRLKSRFAKISSLLLDAFEESQIRDFYSESTASFSSKLEDSISINECNDFKKNANSKLNELTSAINQFKILQHLLY